MPRRLILWSLVLGSTLQAQGQAPARPAAPVQRPAAQAARPADQHTIDPDEAIDPRVAEQLRLPATGAERVDPSRRRQAAEDATRDMRPAAGAQGQSAAIDLGVMRDRAGAVTDVRIVRENQSVAEPAPDSVVTLRRGDILALRRAEATQPVIAPDGVVTAPSPTVLYTVDRRGQPRGLGLVHRSAGLFWQPDRSRFAGELLIGVVDRENPQAAGPLDATIPIQLLAAPGALDRTTIEVTSIGLPFERVRVAIEVPEDPFAIELISQIDQDLPNAALRVVRPLLSLTAPDELQGFGIGQATVTVSAPGASLRPGQAITLSLDNGWLAEQTIVVTETGTASTRIRSDWMGRGTLRVVSPAIYEAAPKEIRYTAPLPFLAATLIGGMLGALVLVYMMKRTDPSARRSYALDWVVGVVVGVGATIMAYAGMKLPEWIPVPTMLAGEVAPFALSFICAAAGAAVIHSIMGAAGRAR